MFTPTNERHNEDHRPFETVEVPSEDVRCVNCASWNTPRGIGITLIDKFNLCGNADVDVSGKHFVVTAADAHCGNFAPSAEYLEDLQERRAA